ncbi:MAG: tautomerase family protein [Acidobacteriota bacterium]|nr:tautomerase family protein [Acidobacteriota bacterium]
MPLYRCVIPEGALTNNQRVEIAKAFTDVHCGASGAPRNFVHVVFLESTGATEIADTHGNGVITFETPYFIAGGNRGGRPPALKARILAGLLEKFSQIAKVPPEQVSGRISETPASWTMEAGKILPEPGKESAEWYQHAAVSG